MQVDFFPSVFLLQGFYEACDRGHYSGHKISGVKFVLIDGELSYGYFYIFWSV